MKDRRDVTNTKRTRHVHKQRTGVQNVPAAQGWRRVRERGQKQALVAQVRAVLGSSLFRGSPNNVQASGMRACGPGALARMLVTSYDPTETHLDPADQCAPL